MGQFGFRFPSLLRPPSLRGWLGGDEGAGGGEYDGGGLLGLTTGASIARGATTGGGEKRGGA